MKVRQTFLRPGMYHGHKVTADMIADHVRGTKEMIADGYAPFLFLEHPPKGSDEGAPKPRDTKIEQLRGAAGWLEDVMVGDDGAAEYELDVTDSEIAKKLQEKSIRFTSPELRPEFRVGNKVYKNVFSHVALTHRPRNPEQSELEPALQFSLDDWEPLQMADDEKDDDEKEKPDSSESPAEPEVATAAPEEPANPDMPEGSNDSENKLSQRREAIVAHLAELGVALPDDTREVDEDIFLDRLLTGLMTASLAKQQAEPEEPEKEDDEPKVVEQSGMMQYSLADVDTMENKLLRKVILGEKAALEAKLTAMVQKTKITPAAQQALLAIDGVMQFSADGDFAATLTIGQVVDVLDKWLPEGAALTEQQIADQFSLEAHPDGDAHYKQDALLTAEQAKKINDGLAAKGVLPPQRT